VYQYGWTWDMLRLLERCHAVMTGVFVGRILAMRFGYFGLYASLWITTLPSLKWCQCDGHFQTVTCRPHCRARHFTTRNLPPFTLLASTPTHMRASDLTCESCCRERHQWGISCKASKHRRRFDAVQ